MRSLFKIQLTLAIFLISILVLSGCATKKTEEVKEIDTCLDFRTQDELNYCYTDKAMKSFSFKPCEKIKDNIPKYECFRQVVWDRTVRTDCSVIENQDDEDFCNLLISRELGIEKRCEMIASQVLKDQCYTELLNSFDKLPDKNLCEKVIGADSKALCQYMFKQKMELITTNYIK